MRFHKHISSLCAAWTVAFALSVQTFNIVPAQGAEPIVINLISLPAAAAQVYFAQDMGFFKAAGLDVHITSMRSSPAIIAAIASAAADIGFAAVGSAAAARQHGLLVRYVAAGGLCVSSNPTSLLVGPKDTPIRTAADLNGKTIAVTGLADLTYFATKAWIDKNGGNPSSVKFVELPFPEMAPALVQHRVDAAVTTEPFLTMAKDYEKVIGPINDAIASRFTITGWLAREAWIDGHPDAAARFATAMRQAAQWGNAHHRESAQILVRYVGLTPQVAAKMLSVEYALTLDPRLIQPPIDNAAKYGSSQQSPMPATDLIWTPSQ